MSLVVIARNETYEPPGNQVLAREDGTADYKVQILINERPIWIGDVINHVRNEGASALLRRIADTMDGHHTGTIKRRRTT